MTDLPADAAVPARVRVGLDAGPGLVKGGHGQAGVDVALGRQGAQLLVDGPVDAVAGDLVAGAERVGVVGEGACGDALCFTVIFVSPGARKRDGTVRRHTVGFLAVAAKAVGRVEEDGGAEFACVALLGPVARRYKRPPSVGGSSCAERWETYG